MVRPRGNCRSSWQLAKVGGGKWNSITAVYCAGYIYGCCVRNFSSSAVQASGTM